MTPSASIGRLALAFSGHKRGTTQNANRVSRSSTTSRCLVRRPTLIASRAPWRRPPPPPGQRVPTAPHWKSALPEVRREMGLSTPPRLLSPDSTPAGGAGHGGSGTLPEVDSAWPLQRQSSNPFSVETWARRRLRCRLRRRGEDCSVCWPGDAPPAPRLVADPEPSPGTRTPLLVQPTDRAPASGP